MVSEDSFDQLTFPLASYPAKSITALRDALIGDPQSISDFRAVFTTTTAQRTDDWLHRAYMALMMGPGRVSFDAQWETATQSYFAGFPAGLQSLATHISCEGAFLRDFIIRPELFALAGQPPFLCTDLTDPFPCSRLIQLIRAILAATPTVRRYISSDHRYRDLLRVSLCNSDFAIGKTAASYDVHDGVPMQLLTRQHAGDSADIIPYVEADRMVPQAPQLAYVLSSGWSTGMPSSQITSATHHHAQQFRIRRDGQQRYLMHVGPANLDVYNSFGLQQIAHRQEVRRLESELAQEVAKNTAAANRERQYILTNRGLLGPPLDPFAIAGSSLMHGNTMISSPSVSVAHAPSQLLTMPLASPQDVLAMLTRRPVVASIGFSTSMVASMPSMFSTAPFTSPAMTSGFTFASMIPPVAVSPPAWYSPASSSLPFPLLPNIPFSLPLFSPSPFASPAVAHNSNGVAEHMDRAHAKERELVEAKGKADRLEIVAEASRVALAEAHAAIEALTQNQTAAYSAPPTTLATTASLLATALPTSSTAATYPQAMYIGAIGAVSPLPNLSMRGMRAAAPSPLKGLPMPPCFSGEEKGVHALRWLKTVQRYWEFNLQ